MKSHIQLRGSASLVCEVPLRAGHEDQETFPTGPRGTFSGLGGLDVLRGTGWEGFRDQWWLGSGEAT